MRYLVILITMAYLNMNSRVTIGDVVFKNISSFDIVENIADISDTATIVLPRNFRQLNGRPVTDYIKAGMPVLIEAGYDDVYNTEYAGYVSEAPTADIPLEVKCDELFPLRSGTIVKSYKAATLKQVLTDNIKGYSIECFDVSLGKVLIDNVSPYQLLEDMRKNFGFYSRIYPGNILHCGWAYDWQNDYTKRHKLQFAKNIKNSKALKFKHKEDFNTRVKITIIKADGSKEVINAGSKNEAAAESKITVANMSKADAEKMALSRYVKQSWDGFEGSVKCWGTPLVHAGDTVEFISEKYPERNGSYLAEKVTVRYTDSFMERDIKIGNKL
jgi:hypothetical protein